MHWRITVEAVDPTGEEYRKEFLVEKNLDELTDGRIGFSIDDGKTVMAEIQKAVVLWELDLWVRYRRVCQSCGGQLPIKDYQKRNIITVFGSVPVTYPRLILCQKCNPWTSFTLSPAADLCPDRATPELMELSARLGARLPFREASDILATFLPCHLSRKFTALRHRAIAIGKRLWHEHLGYIHRPSSSCLWRAILRGKSSSLSILRISRWSGIGAVGRLKRSLAIAVAADEEAAQARFLRSRERIRPS